MYETSFIMDLSRAYSSHNRQEGDAGWISGGIASYDALFPHCSVSLFHSLLGTEEVKPPKGKLLSSSPFNEPFVILLSPSSSNAVVLPESLSLLAE